MMALPFFTSFAALLCALKGNRGVGIALWALTAALLLYLFRYHATDTLNLDF